VLHDLREVMRVGRTCDADAVVAVIEALVAERGAPEHLRMDNGPELIAWALRDWCRLAGTGTVYIEPASPWENPFIESFNGRVRDELLNIEEFGSLLEAQVVVEACASSTTPIGLTHRSVVSPPPSTRPSTNQHSHNRWTTQRGPVNRRCARRGRLSWALPGPQLRDHSLAEEAPGLRVSVWGSELVGPDDQQAVDAKAQESAQFLDAPIWRPDDGESVDEILPEERHVGRVGSPVTGSVVVRTNGLDHSGVVSAYASGRMARHGLEPGIHRRHALDELACCNR
jgi:hypothetical protein